MGFFLTFILPILIVTVIAALLAFCLSFLGEKMSVNHDPRIDEIESNLSGANCGGCGYPGCAQFAKALFEGNASLDACNPTNSAGKKNIAAILGMNLGESRRTVAIVRCIGGKKCKNKYSYQGFGDCTSAEIIAGGSKACHVGCLGLGTCTMSCKYDAIAVDKDTAFARVKYKECESCGACVIACPKKIIGRIPEDAKVYIACSNTNRGKDVINVCENGCIACGKCEKNCPQNAIAMTNNIPVIDYDKCNGCGECIKQCPRKCILPF